MCLHTSLCLNFKIVFLNVWIVLLVILHKKSLIIIYIFMPLYVKPSEFYLLAPFHLTSLPGLPTKDPTLHLGVLQARFGCFYLLSFHRFRLEFCYPSYSPYSLFSRLSCHYPSPGGIHQWSGHLFPRDHVYFGTSDRPFRLNYTIQGYQGLPGIHAGQCQQSFLDCWFLHLQPAQAWIYTYV